MIWSDRCYISWFRCFSGCFSCQGSIPLQSVIPSNHRLSLFLFNKAPGIKIEATGKPLSIIPCSDNPFVLVTKKMDFLSAPMVESREKWGISAKIIHLREFINGNFSNLTIFSSDVSRELNICEIYFFKFFL